MMYPMRQPGAKHATRGNDPVVKRPPRHVLLIACSKNLPAIRHEPRLGEKMPRTCGLNSRVWQTHYPLLFYAPMQSSPVAQFGPISTSVPQ